MPDFEQKTTRLRWDGYNMDAVSMSAQNDNRERIGGSG